MSAAYEILAIDYYDGAIEGFAVHRADDIVSYFRLLAWDRDQDERLFVDVDVSAKDLLRLEELLKASGQSPKQHTWIPEWRFTRSLDAAEADQIVEQCRRRLKEAGRFMLGSQPGVAKTIAPVTRALQQHVEKAIERGAVDDLAHWLPRLDPDTPTEGS